MEEEEHPVLKLSTGKYCSLQESTLHYWKKRFNIKAEISIRRNPGQKSILYLIAVSGQTDRERILQAAKAGSG